MTKAFFPEGVDDPNLLLIKVDPSQADYWDSSSSKLVQLFKLVKAVATETRYDGGDYGHVDNI